MLYTNNKFFTIYLILKEGILLKDKKSIIVSLLVIFLAVAALFGYKTYINSQKVEGRKEYTLVVRDVDNTFNKEYKFNTEETSLGKDLEERGLIVIDKSGSMPFVTGVDGIDADSSKQEWWNLKVNGENSNVNVNDTAINNGDKVEFVLTTGW